MRKTFDEILQRDNDGNVVLEQHTDGFREESTYVNHKLVRRFTKYPNGMSELEHYAAPQNGGKI